MDEGSFVMHIYHGSPNIIEKPLYGLGKLHNDYGRGFYCTENRDMASEWAVGPDKDGVVNHYEIDISDLNVLNLNSGEYSILNWLAILLENRSFDIQTDFGTEAKRYILDNFHVDYKNYDIITGYRADDRYFSYAQDFLNNIISIRTFSTAMQLGDLGEQIVIKSPKAFDNICFIDYIDVKSQDYYLKKSVRDTSARKQYDTLRREPWKRGEIYVLQIIDEEINNNDERIRFRFS